MLEFISYFVIPVLVMLVVAYFYVEMQKRKINEEKKKAIILRVASIKQNFKADLNRLVEQQTLTVREQESAYRIANNFFVFQSVTIESIDYCEQLLNKVISAMQCGGPDTLNFDLVQEKIRLFIRSLPAAASGYKVTFYRNELPKLIKQLVDSQENIYEIEDALNSDIRIETENGSDQSQAAASTAAA